ncbi:phosphoenolpyruvate carboxylase [Natronomonas moolapensis 8.8.11]|uniref:phosphoenolpyruvate carboxylase n=1 Tax=Natronomonas moolapensis (strain DSM 18674 / CECT 7526 / JCM 14361 / 8.8.11) TaxID=268739 RepID=M1XPQ6_NATM8|nr:phosphoenolpyruvate carboxylase [Natronomonas moolapensis]CCQ36057.1 phosphoenolpyruvate carboxylase [Natronomonas moolapensis 8.8.11]
MRLHRRDIQRDIRELGAMLGDTIEAQESRAAFDTVERLRKRSVDRRSGGGDVGSIRTELDDLDADRELVAASAFTTYFELINLAEERERIRALREQAQAGVPDDGLEEAADALAGNDAEDIASILEDVYIQPTFTAHPTEARRKTVKAKLRSVSSSLETLDERLLTDKEGGQVERELRAEVTSLWQTPQIRQRRPEPTDEALNVQWYLENTLFDVVGEVYQELEDALAERSAFDAEQRVPTLFEFRSWAGSDRDGNPYVTPEVTTATLSRQRRVVLEKYREELKRLSGVLSQDSDHVEIGSEVDERLAHHEEALPSVSAEAEERYPDEPYRQLLRLMRERLDRVGTVRPGEYGHVDEFVADLDAIGDDLRSNAAGNVADVHVDPLRRQVETFGFTLASLDLRDHQENHTLAIEAALERQGIDYAGLDETERVEFLTDAIAEDDPILEFDDLGELDETTERVLTRFERLADWQREYGTDAIDTYCISMCEEPSHVLEVLFLADQVDVVDLPGHSGLDVVPLLETEYALSGARRIIGTLFENDAYAAALEARGGTQEVMLGYSDSCKENGFFAAQWSLQRNEKRLANICSDYGVDLRLFHGRGGSISRGGGPMNDALLALPNETVTGEVKFTEQGEAIAEKYASPKIAERELEQMLNAQLRARQGAIERPTEPVEEEWIEAMETGAAAAREAYEDLLETEGFVAFFEQATPITVIENLNLGSRPASRSGERTVEDLRAIPWVFAWTQARCIVPGWYSLATGLDAYLEDGGDIETLEEMYEAWPFFRSMLDNAAIALAKTDMTIAAEYAALAEEDLRERIFTDIEAEYERAVGLVSEITGGDSLPLSGWFEESLRRRNPYVDPLNLLQLRLLSRSERSEAERRALRMTVKGIAAGMKNTG